MSRRLPLRPLAGLAVLSLFAAIGPWLHGTDPAAIDLARTAAPASALHPLGTDESGRDVLARLMAGGRVSLLVGVAAGLVALLVGTGVGALAASRRRWLAEPVSRLLDAALAVPAFFLLLVIMTLFGGSAASLVLAVGLTAWTGIARLVRAETMTLREREYVLSAEALGQSRFGGFRRHVLPHLVPVLTAAASVGVAQAVLTESALSFLGLGVEPPQASWGSMLTGAQQNLATAPWLAVYPGLLIVATVLACNALAEAVRTRQPGPPR
ncbi:MAG: ABC transporter permease [Gemmatimonadales bacterium]|nr:ABC transporter permease [Gemmatimonadales bacterium]